MAVVFFGQFNSVVLNSETYNTDFSCYRCWFIVLRLVSFYNTRFYLIIWTIIIIPTLPLCILCAFSLRSKKAYISL